MSRKKPKEGQGAGCANCREKNKCWPRGNAPAEGKCIRWKLEGAKE